MNQATGSTGSTRSANESPSQEPETVWSFLAQIQGSEGGELNLSIGCYKRWPGGMCWAEWNDSAIATIYHAMTEELLMGSKEATLELVMFCHSTKTRVVRGRYRIEFDAKTEEQETFTRIEPA